MMNDYTNFTQKYRPASFAELHGQQVLKKSFSNAFVRGSIYHSYIFTGSSGIGKTTVARILAKMLNCTQLIKKEEFLLPCNQCQNCISISNSSHPDVFEFDAASKTSVDDIRDVISNAEFLPIAAKYKIFIIDEVHMLSKNAFNALLKIIEEPPKYVVFFLATTEINKIPDTIISRCNSYKLIKLTYLETKALIMNIARQENIEIEQQALELLSDKVNGSARLALIYLEQILNYRQDNKILIDDVMSVLGVQTFDSFIQLLDFFSHQNISDALSLIKEIYTNTNNVSLFLSGFSDFIAELIKLKFLTNYKNILYKKYYTQMLDLSKQFSIEKLTILWQIFTQSIQEIGNSHNVLLFLEMNIIKSLFSVSLPDIASVNTNNTNNKNDFENSDILNMDNYLSENNLVIKFVKFVYAEKAIEIYHILLNNAEFLLDGDVLYIYTDLDLYDSSEFVDVKVKENHKLFQLKKLFENFCQHSFPSASSLKIVFSFKNDIKNLKSKIINHVIHSDQNFKLLQKKFDDIEISDILLEKY